MSVMRKKKEMLMKQWKRTLLIVLAILTILSLLLSACVTIHIGGSQGNSNDAKDKNKDNDNGNNKDKDINADKITICHRTGSAKHPYVEITVANAAVQNGHAKHKGDIIPAPEGGCPTTVLVTNTPGQ